MGMLVKFTKSFQKEYKKASQKIKSQFDDRLKIFLVNEFAVVLNNHALTGKYKGHRSINVTGDWRVIYRVSLGIAFFEALGTHSQLYG